MVQLLLDTHVFLWWRTDDRRVRGVARDAISKADVVFVSVASAWEVAIKSRLGRLTLLADFAAGIDESGFERLSISFAHADETARLPDHHRDPFDRMLVSQARVERLTLTTHDRALEPYDVDKLWI